MGADPASIFHPSMPQFLVIGHKNPDTDAICSAIGYASLLRATGEEPEATTTAPATGSSN